MSIYQNKRIGPRIVEHTNALQTLAAQGLPHSDITLGERGYTAVD